jgi:poly-gamma-glutamate system protein
MNKKRNLNNVSLSILLVISAVSIFAVNNLFVNSVHHPKSELMKKSVELTKKWFELVSEEKTKKNIFCDAESVVKYRAMLGNDFTEITTTLGSLESKELSTNPQFAAVITKILLDTDIGFNSKVGVVLSASFPSLGISTLAALQTLGADVTMFSSLGASAYGANQPGATWVDMENWLIKSGGLKYSTDLLTYGAENDNGLGLTDVGRQFINDAVERNGYELFLPASLEESISVKYDFLKRKNIALYINIGGNQASVGRCPHASVIPNGYNTPARICIDPERGLLSRFSEMGIPFLHLLNIKELAIKSGIPLNPGITYGEAGNIYLIQKYNKFLALCFICAIISVLIFLRYKRINMNTKFYLFLNNQ